MRKSKQFLGMPVISLEEGQQIGTIRGLVVSPALKKVAALIIEQKGWFREQKFIPFSKVHNIGDDAVTIDRVSRVEKGSSLPEILKLIKERVHINGSRMLTESGASLGTADEYYIDLQTGDIVGLEFSGGSVSTLYKGSAFLDINYVRTLGASVIICSDSAPDNIVKMDGGLKETLRVFGESTGQLLENTYQKTRGLGRNLNQSLSQSIEKLKARKKTNDGEEAGDPENREPDPRDQGCSCEQHIPPPPAESPPAEDQAPKDRIN